MVPLASTAVTDPSMLPPMPMSQMSGLNPTSEIFNRLLKDRIVILGTDVNDDIANIICAQMLYLEGEDGNKDIRFTCDHDCGGGGIEIAMAKDSKSAIVHLEVIGVYDRKHPKRDPITLEGSADDKVFRLEHVDISECVELMPGRKEVASLQRK